MPIQLPKLTPIAFAVTGGLDLVTAAMSMKPGRAIDAKNYEPYIFGGARRINGFDAFDGRALPSSSSYWMMPITTTGAIAVGDTVTGATSAATAKVLAIVSSTSLVVGRLSGTFSVAENITIAAVVVGTVAAATTINGATMSSDHANYLNLAANDWRTLIGAVPGSGRIRGVWVYNDVVYAFRDNAGATAGDMYKATASGWSKITFGTEIQFTGAIAQVNDGDTITGGTSGATATVVRAMLRSGTWASAGAGTLIITVTSGTWQSGEAIKVAAATKVTSASLATAIARAVGGSMEFCNYNFTGSSSTGLKMYGCDGVNLAFEFDGTNYIPIRTGMTVDKPSHIICHANYLWLSFYGSVQKSSINSPYQWTAITGAAEISTGDNVTGFLSQPGSSNNTALAIFTASKTFVLYGASGGTFYMVPSKGDIGYAPFTMQGIGNNSMGLTARGIQKLSTTLNFGDFEYGSVSQEVQPLLDLKAGLAIASTTIKSKNQYRVYFSDNTGLIVGLAGDKVTGILPVDYGIPVRCMCTATLTTGAEVTYFGSDDGYVYRDGVGSSFNGSVIESWIRLAFNNVNSPQMLKRFMRAYLDVMVEQYCEVNISYDLGYGNPDVLPSAMQADTAMTGAGDYWDRMTWDSFTWDTQSVSTPSLSINGTESNISMIFYSNRAQDYPHILQGVTFTMAARRLKR